MNVGVFKQISILTLRGGGELLLFYLLGGVRGWTIFKGTMGMFLRGHLEWYSKGHPVVVLERGIPGDAQR